MLPMPLMSSAAKSLSFTLQVSQYNILAANLANNLRKYLRLFDHEPTNPYRIDVLTHADAAKDVHTEGPAVALKCLLETATFDFFHRNINNNTQGNTYLAHYLFDRKNPDFQVVEHALLFPLGYSLSLDDWKEAEGLRKDIDETLAGSVDRAAAIDRFNVWLRRVLVLRRRHSHHKGVLEHFELSDGRIEEEFREVALEMATFMSLSAADMDRISRFQHRMEWNLRGPAIMEVIEGLQADVLGLEEVDKVEDVREHLEARGLRMAVYKHRHARATGDGCAIFYNPRVLRLCRLGGVPQEEEEAIHGGALGEMDGKGPRAVAVVRYSAEAYMQQQPTANGIPDCPTARTRGEVDADALPLFRSTLKMQGRIVAGETSDNGEGGADEASMLKGQGGEEGVSEDFVDSWTFTAPEGLTRCEGKSWDDWVAVVALLEHRATGQRLLTVCSQLAHSPELRAAPGVRAVQVRELERALREIRKVWGLVETEGGEKGTVERQEQRNRAWGQVPTLIMMDGNEAPFLGPEEPSLANEGRTPDGRTGETEVERKKVYTPMYLAMREEMGYVDVLGEEFGPTSITLQGRSRVDYIWVTGEGQRVSGKKSWETGDGLAIGKERREGVFLEDVDVSPVMDVRLAGEEGGQMFLVSKGEEREKAVYGLPLPAVEDQECIPSDHVPVSAKLRFRIERSKHGGSGKSNDKLEVLREN
ncbi:carbon catabolite repressor protein 4-like 4 [Nannochloropsis gaditana CCMP526]|uniref:carbon catabolite repressor protein 4-like 4 n=1 Tax=Nannochloropsis gaditana (strain CCMP526) TaxID=1093141 RepID=UPI00029F70D8|nr:carbon catabolite repressor protein 4-like 4 [Nannochloropsis gaditana CCMP526]EKU23007.1 carbon catabolite repressor protein 4-like 4 [Nannochloropsis gaditana CCMP526]|eukprot:XP_005853354.1 carbon catabolite repressor protein 4-like 4 [Nannochloropsis gaditana CCMP526]